MPPTGLPCSITIVVTLLPSVGPLSPPLSFFSTTRRTMATTTTAIPASARVVLEFIVRSFARARADARAGFARLGSERRRRASGEAESDQQTPAGRVEARCAGPRLG